MVAAYRVGRNPARVQRSGAATAGPGQGRVAVLDGLRGVAILLVLVLHFALYGGEKPSSTVERLLYAGMTAGWVGVDLFFVLSGFLITGILYRARGGQHYFRNFYMRRVLRIFPLYYASLFVFLVVLPASSAGGALQPLRAEAPWFVAYLTNVRVAQDGWASSGMLGHFWSLAVEEQFYLFWPLLVLAFRRRTLLRVCVGIMAASLLLRVALHAGGAATAAYVLMPARVDSLAVGAAVALLAHGRAGIAPWARPARLCLLLAAPAVVALAIPSRGLPAESLLVGTVGYTLLALLFGSVVVLALAASESAALARVLCARTLKTFGRYSYGLYVIHQPVLFLLPAWWSIDAWRPFLGSWILAWAAFALSAGALCMGLAALSWHLLEMPFLRLKRHFEQLPGAAPALRRRPVLLPSRHDAR